MTKVTKLFLGLGILGMLVLLVLITAIIAIPILFVPHHNPDYSTPIKCSYNLKSLYTGLFLYQAEYGAYPDGQGSALWEALRTRPTPETSVMMNQQDDIYLCPFRKDKTTIGPGICHYRGPNYTVTDEIDGNTPLGADLPNNHPDGTIHVLYMNGMVELVKPKTPEWSKAEKYLTK